MKQILRHCWHTFFIIIMHMPTLSKDTTENNLQKQNIEKIAKSVPYIRSSSEPYISGDSFRALANHLFDETNTNFDPGDVKTGDIIFIKTDYLEDFFKTKHPFILTRYIIITHNSDIGAPGIFEPFLDDEKIIAWFGQNATVTNHKKFIPIPIGIANQYLRHGQLSTFNNVLSDLKANPVSKQYLVGINFRPETTIRKPIYEYLTQQKFCVPLEGKHSEYLVYMAKSKFIPSPPGNGFDCHRTWEALLVGAIPIIEHSLLDEMFTDLPILIIDDWLAITEDYLNAKYQDMQQISFNNEKIYFNYWKDLIYSYQKKDTPIN